MPRPRGCDLFNGEDLRTPKVTEHSARPFIDGTADTRGDFLDRDALHEEARRDRHHERVFRGLAEEERDERMELRGAQDRERHTARRDYLLRLELALVVRKRNAIDANDRDIEQMLHAGCSSHVHETLRSLDVNRTSVPRIARRVDDDVNSRDGLGQTGAGCQIPDETGHSRVGDCSLDTAQDSNGMAGC